VAWSSEYGNELSGSMERGDFLDRLIDYWLLRMDSYCGTGFMVCVGRSLAMGRSPSKEPYQMCKELVDS
jgi:hypothetical protein